MPTKIKSKEWNYLFSLHTKKLRSNGYRVPIFYWGKLLSVEDGASVPETTAGPKVLAPRWAEFCVSPLSWGPCFLRPLPSVALGARVSMKAQAFSSGVGFTRHPASQSSLWAHLLAAGPFLESSLQLWFLPLSQALAGVLGNCVSNPPLDASRLSPRQLSFSESPAVHIQPLLPVTPVVFLIGPCWHTGHTQTSCSWKSHLFKPRQQAGRRHSHSIISWQRIPTRGMS